MKQKAAKVILKAGTAVWLVARAVPSSDLGDVIFLHRIFVFQPESAPNPFLLLQDSIFKIFVPEIK